MMISMISEHEQAHRVRIALNLPWHVTYGRVYNKFQRPINFVCLYEDELRFVANAVCPGFFLVYQSQYSEHWCLELLRELFDMSMVPEALLIRIIMRVNDFDGLKCKPDMFLLRDIFNYQKERYDALCN